MYIPTVLKCSIFLKMTPADYQKEYQIETCLRKHSWLLYTVTFVTATALYAGIYWGLILFREGHYWSLLLSGLFAHSFFVITMHDGAHNSITETKLDRIIMNFCAGLIVLPLYTELFRKYHLLHHAYTNTEDDPLWTPQKKKLFNNNRLLYAFLQCLPFAFNLYVLIQRSKDKTRKKPTTLRPSIPHILFSFAVATTVIILVKPSVWFVLGTFTVMTTLGAFRYWGEHMGVTHDKDSNTHFFPLGMGIGNHDVHHHRPDFSWLTLSIGSFYRKMDTNPLKSFYRLLFDKRFHHYSESKQNPSSPD